ncbi:MAG: ABC transporter ATP-binding protein [Acidobacteriota bacterium]|nr:ABC transporter ATP-binding protein [Acidobacteriota bacterium]
MSDVLEFRISASYGDTRVLDGVEGRIARGEAVALVGLSGSGKSTLALALMRLLRYRGGSVNGSIRLEGEELIGAGEGRMRQLRGRRIGYVPQNPAAALNPRLRIRTLLDETWRAHSGEKPGEGFFRQLLESVQLAADAEFLKRRAGELSTGQGQRLLIALAIMHEPAFLIADEPTSALDVITQAAVLRLFRKLNEERKMAMLFISHDLLSVAEVARRVDILHRGRLVESGPPAEIFTRPAHEFTRELVAALPRPPAT